MTEQTQPTDAELAALRAEFGITSNGRGIKEFTQVRDFARAVLAKWGTPAEAGELVACTYGDNGYACCEGGPCQADVHNASITIPQPTQAQAGAMPLPQYRLLEPRVDIIEAGDEYLQDDAQTWATDPNGTFVGNLYGYVIRAARRRIAKKEGADHA